MDLRNSNGIEFRKFYFTTVQELLSKIFTRSGKNAWASIRVLPYQISKKIVLTFEDSDLLQESHAKLYKKPGETLGADSV